MNLQQAEASRNLRVHLRETLTSSESPVFPDELDLLLETRLHPREGSEDIGVLPIRLQHLCVLALRLEEKFAAEQHRRCVEIFGEEEYDNERIEYGVYCDLQADPHFNQAPKVWEMLNRRVRRHWKHELFTPEGLEIIFYIDKQFHLFKTRYRMETYEEMMEEADIAIQAMQDELKERTKGAEPPI